MIILKNSRISLFRSKHILEKEKQIYNNWQFKKNISVYNTYFIQKVSVINRNIVSLQRNSNTVLW